MSIKFESHAISRRYRDADHRVATALCLFVALAMLCGLTGGIEVSLL